MAKQNGGFESDTGDAARRLVERITAEGGSTIVSERVNVGGFGRNRTSKSATRRAPKMSERGERDADGDSKPSYINACMALRKMGGFRLNMMGERIERDCEILTEAGYAALREELAEKYKAQWSPADLMQAVLRVASEVPYWPVRESVGALVWDGVPRIGKVAADVLGDASELAKVIVEKWFIGAATRALSPGCQMDTMLILWGDQGTYKTQFVKRLSMGFGSTTAPRIGEKDGILCLHNHWILEFGECDSALSVKSNAEIKAWLSSSSDDVRPPYARQSKRLDRPSVIVGTTNENPSALLTDPTGSRRYHMVHVASRIDLEFVDSMLEKWWAEAFHRARKGEAYWLTDEEDELRASLALAQDDPIGEIVTLWESGRTEYAFTLAELVKGLQDLGERIDCDIKAAKRLAPVLMSLGFERYRAKGGMMWKRKGT
jgi:predicted P-loop ATPase